MIKILFVILGFLIILFLILLSAIVTLFFAPDVFDTVFRPLLEEIPIQKLLLWGK